MEVILNRIDRYIEHIMNNDEKLSDCTQDSKQKVTTIEQSDVSLNHEKSNSVIQFETGFSMI
jgi:hypothetical protein